MFSGVGGRKTRTTTSASREVASEFAGPISTHWESDPKVVTALYSGLYSLPKAVAGGLSPHEALLRVDTKFRGPPPKQLSREGAVQQIGAMEFRKSFLRDIRKPNFRVGLVKSCGGPPEALLNHNDWVTLVYIILDRLWAS